MYVRAISRLDRFHVVSCFSKEPRSSSPAKLEFHKFRTLILINPDVALFAYEKIRRKTAGAAGTSNRWKREYCCFYPCILQPNND